MSFVIGTCTVVDDSRNVCVNCVNACCITASSQLQAPSGNTAGRPVSPAAGDIYFDTDEGSLMSYTGAEWAKAGGAGPELQTQVTSNDQPWKIVGITQIDNTCESNSDCSGVRYCANTCGFNFLVPGDRRGGCTQMGVTEPFSGSICTGAYVQLGAFRSHSICTCNQYVFLGGTPNMVAGYPCHYSNGSPDYTTLNWASLVSPTGDFVTYSTSFNGEFRRDSCAMTCGARKYWNEYVITSKGGVFGYSGTHTFYGINCYSYPQCPYQIDQIHHPAYNPGQVCYGMVRVTPWRLTCFDGTHCAAFMWDDLQTFIVKQDTLGKGEFEEVCCWAYGRKSNCSCVISKGGLMPLAFGLNDWYKPAVNCSGACFTKCTQPWCHIMFFSSRNDLFMGGMATEKETYTQTFCAFTDGPTIKYGDITCCPAVAFYSCPSSIPCWSDIPICAMFYSKDGCYIYHYDWWESACATCPYSSCGGTCAWCTTGRPNLTVIDRVNLTVNYYGWCEFPCMTPSGCACGCVYGTDPVPVGLSTPYIECCRWCNIKRCNVCKDSINLNSYQFGLPSYCHTIRQNPNGIWSLNSNKHYLYDDNSLVILDLDTCRLACTLNYRTGDVYGIFSERVTSFLRAFSTPPVQLCASSSCMKDSLFPCWTCYIWSGTNYITGTDCLCTCICSITGDQNISLFKHCTGYNLFGCYNPTGCDEMSHFWTTNAYRVSACNCWHLASRSTYVNPVTDHLVMFRLIGTGQGQIPCRVTWAGVLCWDITNCCFSKVHTLWPDLDEKAEECFSCCHGNPCSAAYFPRYNYYFSSPCGHQGIHVKEYGNDVLYRQSGCTDPGGVMIIGDMDLYFNKAQTIPGHCCGCLGAGTFFVKAPYCCPLECIGLPLDNAAKQIFNWAVLGPIHDTTFPFDVADCAGYNYLMTAGDTSFAMGAGVTLGLGDLGTACKIYPEMCVCTDTQWCLIGASDFICRQCYTPVCDTLCNILKCHYTPCCCCCCGRCSLYTIVDNLQPQHFHPTQTVLSVNRFTKYANSTPRTIKYYCSNYSCPLPLGPETLQDFCSPTETIVGRVKRWVCEDYYDCC